jgi:hypothetical protein
MARRRATRDGRSYRSSVYRYVPNSEVPLDTLMVDACSCAIMYADRMGFGAPRVHVTKYPQVHSSV